MNIGNSRDRGHQYSSTIPAFLHEVSERIQGSFDSLKDIQGVTQRFHPFLSIPSSGEMIDVCSLLNIVETVWERKKGSGLCPQVCLWVPVNLEVIAYLAGLRPKNSAYARLLTHAHIFVGCRRFPWPKVARSAVNITGEAKTFPKGEREMILQRSSKDTLSARIKCVI